MMKYNVIKYIGIFLFVILIFVYYKYKKNRVTVYDFEGNWINKDKNQTLSISLGKELPQPSSINVLNTTLIDIINKNYNQTYPINIYFGYNVDNINKSIATFIDTSKSQFNTENTLTLTSPKTLVLTFKNPLYLNFNQTFTKN